MPLQRTPLADMAASQSGRVVEILGGRGVHNRLGQLGIRPGVTLAKISPGAKRGPVVVQVGGSQVCVGFGIAYKILMELTDEKAIVDGES